MSQWRPRGPQSKNWKRTWVSGQYPSLTDRRRTSPARRGWVQKFGPPLNHRGGSRKILPRRRCEAGGDPLGSRARRGPRERPGAGPKTGRRTEAVRTARHCVPRKTSTVTESIPLLCRAPLCCNTRPEGLAPQVRSAESGPAPKHHTGRAFTCGQRVPGRGEYRCSSSH